MKEPALYIRLLLISGVLNAVGQLTMRWGARENKLPFSLHNLPAWLMSSRWWLLGLLLCWSSGLFWAVLVRNVRLVIALPILAGTTYVLTTIGAVAILAERPTPIQWAGLTLVFAGTMLILVK